MYVFRVLGNLGLYGLEFWGCRFFGSRVFWAFGFKAFRVLGVSGFLSGFGCSGWEDVMQWRGGE